MKGMSEAKGTAGIEGMAKSKGASQANMSTKIRKTARGKGTANARQKYKVKRVAKTKRAPRVKRTYKDTMFRAIFKEKENLLSLYNAMHGTAYSNPDDLEMNTLENAIYMGYKNDVSFMINFQLYLYEHQASVNPNMPLRDLFYVSEILQDITKDEDLYSSALKKFPTPRFMVFYNGVEERPERWKIYLSEAFRQSTRNPELELIVTVLNINLGKNKELMKACKVLRDYAVFVQKMRDYSKRMTLEEAVGRTIEECIEEDVLTDFLKKHRAEAKDMCRCLYEYDEEKHIREERKLAREAGWKEGWEDGRQQGMQQGMRQGMQQGMRQGMQQGMRQGIKRGREYNLVSLVCKKLKKNYNVPEIADMLEEDESVIQHIYDVARGLSPDYNPEEVMECLETRQL